MKKFRDMSVSGLIEYYEAEISVGGHALQTEIRRSQARRELVRRGLTTLREIGEHLRSTGYCPKRNMAIAWADLLGRIADSYVFRDKPLKQLDMEAWARWAEKHYEPTENLAFN